MIYNIDCDMNRLRQDCVVIVICLTYNQEQYIQMCIDGFLMQKTDFVFQVLLHDDCSTDSTRSIIEKAVDEHPDILVPIYEYENQYSKGVALTYNLSKICKSKYIAMCEGDDYWCDPYKLQKQYDYMEKHPECSLCMHNTKIIDIEGKKEDKLFFEESYTRRLKSDFFLKSWCVHLSSYFFRNCYDIKPEWGKHYWFGDYVMITNAFYYGTLDVLPDVMSVYRCNNPNGYTKKVNSDLETWIKHEIQRAEYLDKYIKNYDVDEKTRKTIEYKRDFIIDLTAISQMNIEATQLAATNIPNDKKVERLLEIVNRKLLKRICYRVQIDSNNPEIERFIGRFWKNIQHIMDNLEEMRFSVHFTMIPWMIRVYQSEVPEKELLYGIRMSDDNLIGWGDDFEIPSREEIEEEVIHHLEESNDKLQNYKDLVSEHILADEIHKAMGILEKALSEWPTDPDLLYYKGLCLYMDGRMGDALDELAIFSLFYEYDDRVEALLAEIIEG